MVATFWIYARGWRRLDEASGRVLGWADRPRFCYYRRGRLEVASSSAVLRGLRALKDNQPTTVRNGLPLLQRRKRKVSKRISCCCSHKCQRAETRSALVQLNLSTQCANSTQTSVSALQELIVNEDDVTALRSFLKRRNVFDVDLYRFDTDDNYKSTLFYKINPLVCIERCPKIADIVSQRSLREFTRELGLREAAAAPRHESNKLANKSANATTDNDTTVDTDSDFESETYITRSKKSNRNYAKSIENADSNDSRSKHAFRSDKISKSGDRSKYKHYHKTADESNETDTTSPIEKHTEKRKSNRLHTKDSIARDITSTDGHATSLSKEKLGTSKKNLETVRDINKNDESTSKSQRKHIEHSKDHKHNDIGSKNAFRSEKSDFKSYANRQHTRNKTRDRSIDTNDGETEARRKSNRINAKDIAKVNTDKQITRKNNDDNDSDESTSILSRKQKVEIGKHKENKDNSKATENKGNKRRGDNSEESVEDRKERRNLSIARTVASVAKNVEQVNNRVGERRNVAKEKSKDKKEMENDGKRPDNERPRRSTSSYEVTEPLRREYSSLEDHVIVQWLSLGSRARKVNGNRIWRELQSQYPRLAGRARSWHSLRNRYLRGLLPALPALALPPAAVAALRAAHAQGEIKSKRRPPVPHPLLSAPAVCSAWSRRPYRHPHKSDSVDRTEKDSTALSGAPKTRSQTDAQNKDGGATASPSYSDLTRRFAARHSVSTPDGQTEHKGSVSPPPKRTRKLFNPNIKF
ncbi:probable ATP-dependent helicase PF08_0048 isoform X2 [Plodia interpunctella]|uniref:probable ATP-dependent helicase PF08_0048 isoform X2 n=1 Tax=Plodia interpunctella TaxID=58824 RepID=UPI002368024A|nr:probable ATP-dependent helicase PF08_0048 isoform X2 [Plodia interpunctella]